MNPYIIQSKGQFHGKPVEITAQIQTASVLDAMKMYLQSLAKHKVSIDTLKIRDGKDS